VPTFCPGIGKKIGENEKNSEYEVTTWGVYRLPKYSR